MTRACEYCGQSGEQVVPYSFARADLRWLCWAGARDCFVKAWEVFRGNAA